MQDQNVFSMRLDLGDGRFMDVNAREVRRILGLVGGGGRTRVLRRMCLRNRLEVLERVHELLGNDYAKCASISILRLKKILQNARREELTPAVRRKIKVAHTMLAFSTFLAPQDPYAKVADEILYMVQYPDEIDKYNVTEYIIESLRHGTRHARRSLERGHARIVIEGCMLIPQILFCESCEYLPSDIATLAEPQIAAYGQSRLKRIIRRYAPPEIYCGLRGQEHSDSSMGAGGGDGTVPAEMHSSDAEHDSDAASTGGGGGGWTTSSGYGCFQKYDQWYS
ncbi:uncharacterized protein [Triticum aestivum]|uniref:uncharacterized protein isoform X2 n=1 Tax=Triticum aestivum TaxID=4565 RepID=UPI001D02C235|nr:uncharacterized protein LOC123144459 isoform X2 [Triticum aestivum]